MKATAKPPAPRKSLLWMALAAAVFSPVSAAGQVPFPVVWQGMKALMPYETYWSASCASGGKLFIIGGINPDVVFPNGIVGGECSYVQIYDPATDTWSLGAPMPTARYLCSAAVVNGVIYVMGGRLIPENGGALKVNEAYDIATNTWAPRANLPFATGLRGHAGVAVGANVYVLGGNTGAYQKTVKIYNTTTDSWSSGANMPFQVAYGGAAYVASKGKIYYVAGDNGGTGTAKYIGKSWAYNVTANTWGDEAPTVAKINMFATAAHGDFVYAFSGQYNWLGSSSDEDDVYFPGCQALNTNTNTWSYAADLPDPPGRFGPMAGSAGDRIYVCGGIADGQYLALLEELNPVSGIYFEPNPRSVETRQYAAVQTVGTKVYAIGGWDGSIPSATGTVLFYDTSAVSWGSKAATDPVPRYNAASAVWNGKIVVTGGQSGDSGPPDFNPYLVGGSTVLYDPAADAFTALASDPISRTEAFAAVVGNTLYVFGGTDASSNLLSSAMSLNLITNVWTPIDAMPVPISAAATQALGGKIYIMGGYDGVDKPDNLLHDQVLVYDPSNYSYSYRALMPDVTMKSGSCLFGGYIIVDSGYHFYYDPNNDIVYAEMSKYLHVYDPMGDTWSLSPRHWGRANHGCAVVGNSFFSLLGSEWSLPASRLDIANFGGCSLSCSALAAPGSGSAPLSVNFSATATPTACSSSPTFAWDLDGDGGIDSTAQNPLYVYQCPGTYAWTLTTSADGVNCSRSGSVVVTGGPSPTISGPLTGCQDPGVTLSTGSFSSYQWFRNDLPIGGAIQQAITATQSGTYAVRVTDAGGCQATSPARILTLAQGPAPTVSGPTENACPEATITLATGSYSLYQWLFEGFEIPGATDQSYEASLGGNYSVRATDSQGCRGTSLPLGVAITYCPTSEVSPRGAVFPARLVADPSSASGYFLYFQSAGKPDGYNIYEGVIGSWYSHANTPGSFCDVIPEDLSTGEIRAEILPSTGNHYYLVTAFGGGEEGPSGFDGSGLEIPSAMSTCGP